MATADKLHKWSYPEFLEGGWLLSWCMVPLIGGIGSIFHPPQKAGTISGIEVAFCLPIGGLYATYHLFMEPERAIDYIFFLNVFDASWYNSLRWYWISQGCPLISVVDVEDFGLFIQPPYVLESEPPEFLCVREQTHQANRKCVYTYHNHSLS